MGFCILRSKRKKRCILRLTKSKVRIDFTSMARKLRIERSGALCHVINRGNYRADIFATTGARQAFAKTPNEACQKTGWMLHAWCLMTNHYHLALHTPKANLVSGMQWLQATLGARFNRFRNERGHLFQGPLILKDYQGQAVQGGADFYGLSNRKPRF